MSAPVRPQSLEALIGVLLEQHQSHLARLPDAIELAWRVEAAHARHPACPLGLAEHLLLMFEELEAHQAKEEGVLFPRLLAGGSAAVPGAAFSVLSAEHDAQREQLREVRRVTRGYQAPEDACASWRRLYALCEALCGDLEAHLSLEQAGLFGRGTTEPSPGGELDLAQRARAPAA